MKKNKLDIDVLLTNIFVVLLILLCFASIFVIRDYIGYVGYHEARHGTITTVNIYQIFPASIWNGVYGIALTSYYLNTSWYVFANAGGMTEINPIFPCLEPGISVIV